jgi:Cu(I)/Ag(I) efflux system membrane fusion protein
MKTPSILFALLLLTVACGPHHEPETTVEPVAEAAVATPEAFRSGLESQLALYLDLKDALVATNADSAKLGASALVASLSAWTVDSLSTEADSIWTSNKDVIVARANAIVALTDVEAQRMDFESLSMAMINVVEAFGPLSTAVYRQTCPMVRGGSADWLATEEQIANPYHGSRMLRCGDVVRKI